MSIPLKNTKTYGKAAPAPSVGPDPRTQFSQWATQLLGALESRETFGQQHVELGESLVSYQLMSRLVFRVQCFLEFGPVLRTRVG